MALISTKGRYATRVLVYLALHEGDRPARKQDIAEAEAITPAYVEQILIKLKVAGLVRSHRGREGGFSLADDPKAMTVLRVLRAVEGDISVVPCTADEGGGCDRSETCPTRRLWTRANLAVNAVLEGETIAGLAEKVHARRRHGHDFAI